MLAEIGRAVGNLIEAGFIGGTGSNSETLELLNLPGKLAAKFAGATPTFAEPTRILELLAVANSDISRLSFVLHPRTMKVLMLTAVAGGSAFRVEWQVGSGGALASPSTQPVIAWKERYCLLIFRLSNWSILVPSRWSSMAKATASLFLEPRK